MTITAGRDIKKGEHFSITYSHSLWGTQARRAHLFETKKFWCFCPRCKDATEFGKKIPLRQSQLIQFSTNMVSTEGSFTIYVYKKRWVGSQKMSTFIR